MHATDTPVRSTLLHASACLALLVSFALPSFAQQEVDPTYYPIPGTISVAASAPQQQAKAKAKEAKKPTPVMARAQPKKAAGKMTARLNKDAAPVGGTK